ncbi:uncharacterized protein C1orf198 homolog isoform X2 [Physella acuta]|uniref:uncharacterized protein C1orf198 homolog isoform X2 n=1 Tax=Physella acuta TaxID=109671 RepID=UPI0027DE4095|nr:uncharacterized protein C1orf198 homolog isoform X2 [Physella acuta]
MASCAKSNSILDSLADDEKYTRKEQTFFDYLLKSNYLNKQIASLANHFVNYMGDRWYELQNKQKDALLDLLFVDDDIRLLYNRTLLLKNVSKTSFNDNLNGVSSDHDRTDCNYSPETFPRLYINSGQKINVDFENDLWTWRDEHSGPFSWMSRSQQDLTLADLDSENVGKPQPKSQRLDQSQRSVPQFTELSNSWTTDVLENYRKQLRDLTPSGSILAWQKAAEPAVCSKKKSWSKKVLERATSEARLLHEEEGEAHEDNHLVEWSTFVGESGQLAPTDMSMDRGLDESRAVCPVVQTSPVASRTVVQTSPVASRTVVLPSPAHSDWSMESSPDHNTHLLKGMQSPVHHRQEVLHLGPPAEEILRVELDKDQRTLSTALVADGAPADGADEMPTTGFDFLDNW